MTTLQRLQRARQRFALALATRAVLMALVVAAGGFLLVLLVDIALGLSTGAREKLALAPWLAGFATLLWLAWQAVAVSRRASDEQLALWFEQRIPSLRYALVTRVGLESAAQLDAQIVDAPLEQELTTATRRALTPPLIALSVAAALLLVLPSGAVGRVLAPAPGDALDHASAAARAVADPLATIVVRVQPPSYSGIAASTHDGPATVQALIGSRISIEGLGADVAAHTESAVTPSRSTGNRWSIALGVPARAEAVRLRSGARERVLVIEPITDSAPTLTLDAPARDTVMRVATGALALGASLTDDLGLADGAFELIISTGDGELFEFRTLRVAARRFDANVRQATLQGSVSLDSLQLKPGDLIHLRAVATDRNDVTGPGRGASETRTIRVARADEYDSVSVEPAPPIEPEKDALSQRMLLQLTRELVARSRRIGEAATTRESRRIAVDQTKLRQRVGRIVFERLGEDEGEHAHFPGDGHAHGQEGPINPDDILAAAERASNNDPSKLDNHGDETPIVAINRPLLEAYNHMWRAATELETGVPSAAIPWMERAIEALQRARAAERIYLRGRPPAVVVDLARVRLAGKDEGAPTARSARPSADPLRAARLARFDVALGLVSTDAAAAADSLLLLRVTLPAEERAAILAIDAAATALRQGGDVTLALGNARRALVARPPERRALNGWGL